MIVTLGIYELNHNPNGEIWARDSTSAADFLKKVGCPVDDIVYHPYLDYEQVRNAVSDTFWPEETWDENDSPYVISNSYDPNRSSSSYSSRGTGTMYNAWS